jgi:Protein of unknown function (DUF3099)
MNIAERLKLRARKSKPAVVTSLTLSPEQDRHNRMVKYVWAMSLRTICVPIAVLADGPVRWVAAAGTILLPYFAVVVANAMSGGSPSTMQVVQPQVLRLDSRDTAGDSQGSGAA